MSALPPSELHADPLLELLNPEPKRIELPYQWRPRSYQRKAWDYMMHTQRRARAVCMWHRRAGKDLMAVNVISVKSQERVGTYWHLFPTYKQGKNVAWIGSTKDGRKFQDHFHPDLVKTTNSTDLRIDFWNGSSYQVVGSDNIDSLVGTNPVGVVLSEYSLHDPKAWDYLRPILSENDGWAMFIYTARGRNHGYKLWTMASQNPSWFCEKLHAGSGADATKREDGTPVISDEAIDEERRSGMSEEMIQQEYFNSFDAPMVGAYYSQQMDTLLKQGRITRVPHEPGLMVDTFWDLGVGDSTAIWFVQKIGSECRVIDYYEASGEGLPHYAKALTGAYERMAFRKDYTYRFHYAPHDIAQREFTSGRSRIETAKEMGIRFKMIGQHRVEDGIEAVRSILPQCVFDEQKCERGLDGLRTYRKEYDSRLACFRDTPVHDWASHPADAFRIFAMSEKKTGLMKLPTFQSAIDDYDYLRGGT